MKSDLSRFSTNKFISKVMTAGVWIMLASAITLLAYMSFVDTFYFSPSVKSLTTFGLVSLVLNVSLWESFYESLYNKQMSYDMDNTEYSIHKRYYFARKGWKYSDLQKCVRQYNKDFREAWIHDVEDITGRSISDIRTGPYKKNTHKILIWKIKHDKYPSTGVKTANSLLYVLSVGKSGSMKMDIRESEKFHARKLVFKIITSLATSFLVASVGYEFITGNYLSAILKLIVTIVMICFSVFLGASTGYKSAKTKLSTAEAVSEKLEEWKNVIPTEVPYKEHEDSPIEENENNDNNFVEIV